MSVALRRIAPIVLLPFVIAGCGDEPIAPPLMAPGAVDARASGARESVEPADWDFNGNGVVCVKVVPASSKASPRAGSRTIVKDDRGDGSCPGGFTPETLGLALDIAAGARHACLLDADGAAWCWGLNAFGQLGAAIGTQSTVPVAVATTVRFTAIEASHFHTCALGEDQQVYCWGDNRAGQLGDGTTVGRTSPAAVAGGLTFAALDAGFDHTCALTATGEAYCWGGNGEGQLGRTTTATCVALVGGPTTLACGTTPEPATTPLRFVTVSTGLWSTCGLDTDGDAYCWGWDIFHQGGDGTASTGPTPTAVATPPDLASVAAGTVTGCGLDPAGAAYCWGSYPFGTGSAGTGSLVGPHTPEAVLGGHTFTQVVPSDDNNVLQFTCGIDDAGAAWCWGSNSLGQLGTDDPLPSTCFGGQSSSPDCVAEPVPVEGDLTWDALSLGGSFTCGLASGGVPYCWGANHAGGLGDGTTTHRSTPTPVAFP